MPRTFRSKGLAGGVLCLLRTLHCLPWTGNPVSLACQSAGFDQRSYSRRLTELKADLYEALTEVQAHEKQIAGPAKEAARLALEQLEDGLKDMLKQVEQEKRKRKA